MLWTLTPLLGHVAGVPVEEVLPGLLAIGLLGARLATDWVRRRLRWPSVGESTAEPRERAG